MKNFLSLMLAITLSFTLISCSQEPLEDDQAVWNQTWQKFSDISESFEVGHVLVQGNVELNSGKEKASLEGKVNLGFDSRDPEKGVLQLGIDLQADGNLGDQAGKVGVKAELRGLGGLLYARVENFDLLTDNAQTNLFVNMMAAELTSKWFSFPIDGSGAISIKADPLQGKLMGEVAKKHQFLIIKEVLGNRHYQLEVDVPILKEYLQEVAAVSEQPMNKETLTAIDEYFEEPDYQLSVKVGSEFQIEELNLTLNADDLEVGQKLAAHLHLTLGENQTEGDFNLDLTGEEPMSLTGSFQAQHDENDVEISEPEASEPFDLQNLIPFGGMGANLGSEELSEELLDGLEE
ncbi:MAG: hypothetical protein Q8P95_04735 [bacterium]|nr:hypothetical protein [bacterium]